MESRTGRTDPDVWRPAEAASMLWSDDRLLGFGPMDATHEEFFEVTFALLTCDETSLLRAFDAFEAHARKHFEQEDSWMRSANFPARDCHIDEHAAVLKSVQQVRERITSGSAGPELAHDFASHLFEWFPGHADYMDSALAAWMTKLQSGGKPVVLKRSLRP